MASVNRVILVGNCGKDPEIRYLPSGGAVANVSLATTSRRKDKASGEYIEETQWHRVTFFERLAEIVGEYVKKGAPIYVEGRLTYRKYTDKDGIEKNATDIIASEMQLLGGRQQGEEQQQAPQQRQQPPRANGGRNTYADASGKGQPGSKPQSTGSGFDDMVDDPPFF